MPTFDGEKCLNLAVKSLSALLRGMTSNHNRDFYCLNCFHSYSTKHGLEKHERVCNDHDYCHVKMPKEDNKILEYDQVGKSFKVAAIIFADLEFLLKKTDSCQNNPKNPYTEKKAKHTPFGYPLCTNCSFDKTKNTFNYYRGKDCMERLCKDLRDHAVKRINYEKKKNDTTN